MKLSNSKYKIEGNQIYWILYSNRIEFTIEEFMELVKNIKKIGLFSYLEKERISLKHQLLKIINDSIDAHFWENLDTKISREKYIESFLEQCILDIYYKVTK